MERWEFKGRAAPVRRGRRRDGKTEIEQKVWLFDDLGVMQTVERDKQMDGGRMKNYFPASISVCLRVHVCVHD